MSGVRRPLALLLALTLLAGCGGKVDARPSQEPAATPTTKAPPASPAPAAPPPKPLPAPPLLAWPDMPGMLMPGATVECRGAPAPPVPSLPAGAYGAVGPVFSELTGVTDLVTGAPLPDTLAPMPKTLPVYAAGAEAVDSKVAAALAQRLHLPPDLYPSRDRLGYLWSKGDGELRLYASGAVEYRQMPGISLALPEQWPGPNPQGDALQAYLTTVARHFQFLPDDVRPAHPWPGEWGRCFGAYPGAMTALSLQVDRATGDVRYLSYLHRPLASASPYPLRSPAAVWQDPQAAKWGEYEPIIQGGRGTAQFRGIRILDVQLVYWEAPGQAEQRYFVPAYAFRSDKAGVIYASALAVPVASPST